MIFKLHYWFLASGFNAAGILLGVFMEEYTDAHPFEIGCLFMIMPLTGIIFRPIICAMADREQAHKKYLMICLTLVGISYSPFVIIPLIGPSLYVNHARFCFYFLVILKTIGDVAVGGVISIGDSLAINYAKRIGVEFSVYRVWGTVAWMFFGIVTGQINETPLLPKYVPGFIVLIASNFGNMIIVWLWPDEYFVLVVETQEKVEHLDSSKKESSLTKSLMPKEVVLAHMRKKIVSLFSCWKSSKNSIETVPNRAIDMESNAISIVKRKQDSISKKTQLRILAKLLTRDPRIILYLMVFVISGAGMATLGFFYISLSEICHDGGRCDFSQLGGFTQATMAMAEIIVFSNIKRMQESLGRVNLCSLAMLFSAIKFTFYGTVWSSVNPYFAMLIECCHGMSFAIYITLMAELGHLFANEVQFILPELIEQGIISPNEDPGKLKLSLSATMQALTGSANDGLGRGLGSLIYGLILQSYSFETLWLILGISYGIFLIITIVVNLVDITFKIQPGLDVAAKKQLAGKNCKQISPDRAI